MSLEWNSKGVIDGESCESTEEEEETDVRCGVSESLRLGEVVGEKLEVGSRDVVKHIERNGERCKTAEAIDMPFGADTSWPQ